MNHSTVRARGQAPSVEGTPMAHGRPSRRTSYPDLGPGVKRTDPSDPAGWPPWTDAEVLELGPAGEWSSDLELVELVACSRWGLGPELPLIDGAGVARA